MVKILESYENVIAENIEKYGTVLVISKENLKKNNDIIKEVVGNSVEVAWVLKNNAYELGTENIYPIAKEAGANHFFVATLSEAIKLRDMSVDENDIIAVFHGVLPTQLDSFKEHNLIPVLNTISQVKLWNEYASLQQQKLNCYLHVETGMNRLGINIEDVEEVLNNINHLNVQYVISHLACASTPTSIAVINQYNKFINFIKYFPNAKYSLSASEGVFISEKFHFDLVRVGIYHYGVAELASKSYNVVGLYSSILQIKSLKQHESLGYGYIWQAPRDTKIAVIPVGYGDGLVRSYGATGKIFIKEYAVPIIGTISMDMLMVDITNLPKELQKEGQVVEIIGDNIILEDIIKVGNVAAGEAMNSLTIRYPKVVV